ncbi:MAG TPA: hypothetical protein VLN57_21160 [Xanthobacteraceae bacterium]|nr:hypothetical protein [Xanthobacteraceae bacterium]
MTAVVRIAALEAFTALIEQQIPALAGRTCAGQAPSSELEEIPNLSIEPSRWTYEMDSVGDATQVALLPGNVAVWDVGYHEGTCAVSILASSPRQRALLEQQVLDLFLSAKHPLTGMRQPGCLSFLISSCPEVGQFASLFFLEDDAWVETLALDRRYESRIGVGCWIPALVLETPVYEIQTLQLAVGASTTTDPAADPAPPTLEPLELVTINADGSVSPA